MKEKEEEQKLLRENELIAELQEKKRKEEWAKREEKIEKSVNRMANTVVKDLASAEKALEARRIKYEEVKER